MSAPVLVLERVPASLPGAPASQRVELQRAASRAALQRAARELDASIGALGFDALGAPCLEGGWRCSLTHARRIAAAALGRVPLGVDVEPLREPRLQLVERVLSEPERALLAHLPLSVAFARAWTAKEAVLKRAGVGLLELGACRLVSLDDSGRLRVGHRDAVLTVAQRLDLGHVLALCSGVPEEDDAALGRALRAFEEVEA